MFADPQSVTYATVAKSLARIGTTDDSSTYKLMDGTSAVYTLVLTHSFKKRNRVVARLQRDSIVTDPLVPANSVPVSMTATFTIDFPTAGLSVTDAQNLGNALVGFLTSGNILKLANGET